MLCSWRRLPEIAQTACSRRQKHCRRWPGIPKDRSKFCNYPNLSLQDQARNIEKHLFAARMPPLWCHYALFFFLLSLVTAFVLTYEKLFLDNHEPTEKLRYTYWKVFCRFYLWQNHSYHKITNILFIFVNRGPMHEAGHLDNGATMHVTTCNVLAGLLACGAAELSIY